MAKQASWQRLQPHVDSIIPKGVKKGLAALDEREQTLFLVWSFTAEVDNGGFEQFFFNSGGGYASETVDALERIGAADVGALLRRAIDLFPHAVVPRELEARNAALDQLGDDADERFDELLKAYFRIGSDPVLEKLAAYFLRGAA